MGKFSRAKNSPPIEPEGLADFAAGAEAREPLKQVKVPAKKTPAKAPAVKGLDPKAKPSKGLNLRLNEYELALLHKVAVSEDRSVQKVIKRILVPALEKALKE